MSHLPQVNEALYSELWLGIPYRTGDLRRAVQLCHTCFSGRERSWPGPGQRDWWPGGLRGHSSGLSMGPICVYRSLGRSLAYQDVNSTWRRTLFCHMCDKNILCLILHLWCHQFSLWLVLPHALSSCTFLKFSPYTKRVISEFYLLFLSIMCH